MKMSFLKDAMTMTCCLLKTHFKYNEIDKLKIERWKNTQFANYQG